MPPGRQVAYCGKACRREWKRRARPIERVSVVDTIEAFTALLDRMERTVASRVGAGQTIEEAFRRDRWKAELEGDLGERAPLAEHVIAGIAANLAHAVSVDDVHRAFWRMVGRADRLADTIDGLGDEVPSTSPHLIYLLYNRLGRLLYIGVTDRGPVRLVEHYRHKSWFVEVARVDFERCASRGTAISREAHLIRTRRPLYNVQHNRRSA